MTQKSRINLRRLASTWVLDTRWNHLEQAVQGSTTKQTQTWKSRIQLISTKWYLLKTNLCTVRGKHSCRPSRCTKNCLKMCHMPCLAPRVRGLEMNLDLLKRRRHHGSSTKICWSSKGIVQPIQSTIPPSAPVLCKLILSCHLQLRKSSTPQIVSEIRSIRSIILILVLIQRLRGFRTWKTYPKTSSQAQVLIKLKTKEQLQLMFNQPGLHSWIQSVQLGSQNNLMIQVTKNYILKEGS